MGRHVVFGTGQVGHPLVQRLVALGHDVVAVNRDGAGPFPGARVVGGDATDPRFCSEVSAGADAVYFCLNAMSSERWSEEFPPLQRGVLEGAASAEPGSSCWTTSTPTDRPEGSASSRRWPRGRRPTRPPPAPP